MIECPSCDLEILKDRPRQILGMKRLPSTDIGYEKNLSGPNVMSWTLAGTKTTVLEFGWNYNIRPGIWLDNKGVLEFGWTIKVFLNLAGR